MNTKITASSPPDMGDAPIDATFTREPSKQLGNATDKKPTESEFVSFMVGKEHQLFILDKKLLRIASEFFAKALEKIEETAGSTPIILVDTKPSIFSAFALWLRTKKEIPNPKLSMDWFIDGYIYAHKIGCVQWKDFNLNHLQDVFLEPRYNSKGQKLGQRMLTLAQIKKLFANTSHGEPIRKLCGALVSRHLSANRSVEQVEPIFYEVPGFLKEYVGFQNEIRRLKDWDLNGSLNIEPYDDPRISGRYDVYVYGEAEATGFPTCYFHAHDKEEKCDSQSNYVDSDAEEDYELKD